MTAAARMKPLALRRLSEGETQIAREVFGRGIAPERVRIACLPLWPRAFAAGPGLMAFPQACAFADFAAAPLSLQGLFVHELTHVWQAQNGVALLRAKLKAGDSPAAYAYDLDDGRPFAALNIEQQAMVVQHAFLASRGQEDRFPVAAYGAYLAGLARRDHNNPWNV